MEKTNKLNVKSLGLFALELVAPGFYTINKPIEGISNKLRYESKLWRLRMGLLAHGLLAVEAIQREDYLFAAANLSFMALMHKLIGNRLINFKKPKKFN